MNKTMLSYSIGALLYCPANNETIVNSLFYEKFGKQFSLAFCLEDTIPDDMVEKAEKQLIITLQTIINKLTQKSFYLPKIFIRVRKPEQISKLFTQYNEFCSLVKGFIIPKFSLENADAYISEMIRINCLSKQPVYMMPILESETIVNLQHRIRILYLLKEKLSQISDLVLNIRVGGNDLCHIFGLRRHCNESIYDIHPIANILSDIITIFGTEYIISGPVWEYYNGADWERGFIAELQQDRLNGFIGKTVIHPNQIPYVNQLYMVSQKDFKDAKVILNWDNNLNTLVSGSTQNERMNEYKTHFNWAKKIIILSQIYGISDPDN